MAFDEILAGRIRTALARKKNVEEKKMFGGVGFLAVKWKRKLFESSVSLLPGDA